MTIEEIMQLKIKTIDGDNRSLDEMIEDICPEFVDKMRVSATPDENGNHFVRFSGWSENYILVLINTAHGSYLLKHDRKPY